MKPNDLDRVRRLPLVLGGDIVDGVEAGSFRRYTADEVMKINQDFPADNAVAYGMAAKALRVSRRTIERMVERGQLDRAPGVRPASVTRQSLTAAMRNRDADRHDPANDIEGEAATETNENLLQELIRIQEETNEKLDKLINVVASLPRMINTIRENKLR